MINEQPSHHDELSNSNPQLLTEETGQRILQRLDDLFSRIDYIEEAIQRGNAGPQGSAQQTRPAVDGAEQPPQERSQRCKKPKIEDENGSQVAGIKVEHIDEALRDYFHVDPENIVSTRTDLTKHLSGVVRAYIEEQLEHRYKLPPASTLWKHIPKPLVFRAIEKFEEQVERVLRIRLGDCEGSWIARYCLHTGWNNSIAPERKKERAEERAESSPRFRLTPTPPPSSPRNSPRLSIFRNDSGENLVGIDHGNQGVVNEGSSDQGCVTGRGRGGRGRGTRGRGARGRGRGSSNDITFTTSEAPAQPSTTPRIIRQKRQRRA